VAGAADRQLGEVIERGAGGALAQFAGDDRAPQRMTRLGIDQMRSPERSTLGEQRVASLVGLQAGALTARPTLSAASAIRRS